MYVGTMQYNHKTIIVIQIQLHFAGLQSIFVYNIWSNTMAVEPPWSRAFQPSYVHCSPFAGLRWTQLCLWLTKLIVDRSRAIADICAVFCLPLLEKISPRLISENVWKMRAMLWHSKLAAVPCRMVAEDYGENRRRSFTAAVGLLRILFELLFLRDWAN